MDEAKNKNRHGRDLILLGFAAALLALLGTPLNEVFAMGQAPSTCNNRYDGTITAMKITIGARTYDPIAHPGLSFQLRNDRSYTVTFTIHIPNQSSQNNALDGTTWYDTDAQGYQFGTCVSGAAPNQDMTVTATEKHPANLAPQTTQNVTWRTLVPGSIEYNVKWINP